MKYLNWLINQSTFLGLKGGFWFIALPIIVVWIYSEYYLYKRNKKKDDDLELENIIINLSREEKWMLDSLLKSSNLDLDSYIRKILIN